MLKAVSVLYSGFAVRNSDSRTWKQGMASGIATGLRTVITLLAAVERIILAVCDHSFVSASIFRQFCQRQNESGKGIVASLYADTTSTPVLFARTYFDALLHLQGNEGAKKIQKGNAADIATVDFPQGNINIDTQKDYETLLDKQQHVLKKLLPLRVC